MEVILDKSFIMACMRKNIDFITQLEKKGFKIRVPREVIQELKDIKYDQKASHQDRELVKKALEMLRKNKVKGITLGKGKIEHWFIRKGNEGYYIATRNAKIKHHVPKKIAIFKSKTIGIE